MSTQMTMALMLTITAAAAIYVAWPLLFGRVRPEEYLGIEGAEPILQRLYLQRDSTYAAMKELDFDLAMGNLSKEDHEQLQERYKRRALAILKRIDDARAGRLHRAALEIDDESDEMTVEHEPRGRSRVSTQRIETDLEQEIEAFRRRQRSEGTAAASAAVTCPSCGRTVRDSEAAFCSKCGAPISGKGARKKHGNAAKGDR